MDGEASVLLRGNGLSEGGFLNGIDYHPDGFLLVAEGDTGRLLKVNLAGEVDVVAVDLPEPVPADGLTLTPAGDLVAVSSQAVLLRSDDGWQSAVIVGREDVAENATTVAVRDGAVYVLDARFRDMGAPEPAPHFDITRLAFD